MPGTASSRLPGKRVLAHRWRSARSRFSEASSKGGALHLTPPARPHSLHHEPMPCSVRHSAGGLTERGTFIMLWSRPVSYCEPNGPQSSCGVNEATSIFLAPLERCRDKLCVVWSRKRPR